MKNRLKKIFSFLITVSILFSFCFNTAKAASLVLNAQDPEYGGHIEYSRVSGTNWRYNVKAIPASGYRFKKWVEPTGNSRMGFDNYESPETEFYYLPPAIIMPGDDDIHATITAEFEPVYNVNISAQEGGTASANPTSGVTGDVITIRATPSNGYTFDHWQVTDGEVIPADPQNATTYFSMGEAHVDIEAIFKKTPYSITTSVQGRGTASANPSSAGIGDIVTLTANETVPGYSFKEWRSSDVIIMDPQSIDNATFIMPAENVSVTAVFTKTPYEITFSFEGEGSATATPNPAGIDDSVILTATDTSPGYRFKEWRSEDVEITNPQSKTGASFTMPNNAVNITAVFELAPYNITAQVEGEGTAKAEPTSGVIGTPVNLTATPAEGHQFVEWRSDDVQITNPQSSTEAFFDIPANDVTVTAVFEPITYNVTTSVEGQGSVDASPSACAIGTTVTLTATPADGYQFMGWSSEDVDIPNPQNAETSFVMPAKNVDIKAVFKEVHNVTTSVQGQGTATAIPTSGPNGTTVTLKAVPEDGYQFTKWKVLSGGVELANPNSALTTFQMGDEPVEVQAIFEETTVTGISLNSSTAKKEYTVGDELDIQNLVLKVTKSDGTTETVNVTEDMISGFDSSKAGKQTVTVTYAGFTDSYEVEVKEKEVNPTPTPSPTNPSDSTSKTSYNSDYGTSASPNSAYESSGKSGVISVPDTSDHRNLTIWILLMLASLGGLVISSSWWKKRKFLRR